MSDPLASLTQEPIRPSAAYLFVDLAYIAAGGVLFFIALQILGPSLPIDPSAGRELQATIAAYHHQSLVQPFVGLDALAHRSVGALAGQLALSLDTTPQGALYGLKWLAWALFALAASWQQFALRLQWRDVFQTLGLVRKLYFFPVLLIGPALIALALASVSQVLAAAALIVALRVLFFDGGVQTVGTHIVMAIVTAVIAFFGGIEGFTAILFCCVAAVARANSPRLRTVTIAVAVLSVMLILLPVSGSLNHVEVYPVDPLTRYWPLLLAALFPMLAVLPYFALLIREIGFRDLPQKVEIEFPLLFVGMLILALMRPQPLTVILLSAAALYGADRLFAATDFLTFVSEHRRRYSWIAAITLLASVAIWATLLVIQNTQALFDPLNGLILALLACSACSIAAMLVARRGLAYISVFTSLLWPLGLVGVLLLFLSHTWLTGSQVRMFLPMPSVARSCIGTDPMLVFYDRTIWPGAWAGFGAQAAPYFSGTTTATASEALLWLTVIDADHETDPSHLEIARFRTAPGQHGLLVLLNPSETTLRRCGPRR